MMLLEKLIGYYGEDTLVTIESDGDRLVTERGMSEVSAVLNMPPSELPTGFDRRLVTPNGKFTTRLADWAGAWTGEKVGRDKLEKIGLLAEANSTPANVIRFDITSQIMTWPEGSFRKKGSCLRNSYFHHPENMRRMGGKTLRLFAPGGGPNNAFYGTLKGDARAFLLPIHKGTDIMLFNYYGLGGNGEKFGAVLVEAFARMGERTELYKLENISQSSLLYLNESTPWAIGRAGEKHKVSISLKLVNKVKHYTCSICQKKFILESGEDGRSLCPQCGDRCSSCDNWNESYKMFYIHGSNRWYCDRCVSNSATPHKCGRLSEGAWKCECEVCRNE